MFCNSFIVFSFEKYLKGIFFAISLAASESLHEHISLLILLDVELRLVALIEEVNEGLIVEFQIGDGDLDLMFVS
jgi:hypothetical protein